MQGEASSKRLHFGFASLVALIATALFLALPALASAGTNELRPIDPRNSESENFTPDPQVTNIPYVAWDGEEVQLVKCLPDDNLPTSIDDRSNVEFIIEMWSGEDSVLNRPYVEESSISQFSGSGEDRDDANCVSANVVSRKPGLAVIQMVAHTTTGDDRRVAETKHDFLVIWMDLNNPTLVEVGPDEFPGAPDVCGAGGSPEDLELPLDVDLCRLEVVVTGSFPLGQNFSGMIDDGDPDTDTAVLPRDWKLLADNLAVDARVDPQDDPDCVIPAEGVGIESLIVEESPFRRLDQSCEENPDPGAAQGGAGFLWDIHDAGPPPINSGAELTYDGLHDPDNDTSNNRVDEDCGRQPGDVYDSNETLREPVDSCVQGRSTTPGSAGELQFPYLGSSFSPEEASDTSLFSTIYGPSIGAGIGPYDPQRYSETTFADRVVDAGDAPMPAAKVHVRIGDKADDPIDNAGRLEALLKSDLYDRGESNSHRYFAPFYATYLPATEAADAGYGRESSGIAGPRHYNNGAESGFLDCGTTADFNDDAGDGNSVPNESLTNEDDSHSHASCNADSGEGYVREAGDPYVYWLFAHAYNENRGGFNDCNSPAGGAEPKPTGTDHVVVYTDEHGKAELLFRPFAGGFNRRVDSNGRCDPNPGPPTSPSGGPTANPIGRARITAEAKYPYKPVYGQSLKVSNEIVKNIIGKGAKLLDCVPKLVVNPADLDGPLVASDESAICFETITDDFGDPLSGVVVCFSQQSQQGSVGNTDVFTRDQDAFNGYPAVTAGDSSEDSKFGANCVVTGSNGVAAAEITSSLDVCIDIKSENVLTKNGGSPVYRTRGLTFKDNSAPADADRCAKLSINGSSSAGGSTGGGSTTPNTGNQAIVQIGSPTRLVVATKPAVQTVGSRKVTYKVASARIMGRYLVVRVNGASKTVRIRITLVKKGKVTRVVRTIKTNRRVQVPNLRITRAIRSVKVSIA
jgi:hypothetical protein